MVENADQKRAGSTEISSNPKKEELYKKHRGRRPSLINIWGIAGRQEIMEMRRLWQLRVPLNLK